MMKKLFLFLVLSLLVVGCVSMGRKIDQSAIAQIKKGVTTQEEVVKLIGSPDQITTRASGDTIYMYMFMRSTSKPTTFVPVVGIFAGGSKMQNQMLMVAFGSDGVVREVTNSYGGQDVSTGVVTATKASMPDVEENKRPK